MLHVQGGGAFAYVVNQLEKLGYNWAYRVIDSQAFGLPQRRERVFILAALGGDPRGILLGEDAGAPASGSFSQRDASIGFYWTEGKKGLGWAWNAVPALKRGSAVGIASPPSVMLPDGTIVTPDIRDAERLQGFPVNWTAAAGGLKNGRRTRRWGLVGNAVTVDVAEWIGRRLLRREAYDGAQDERVRPGGRWPRAGWSMGRGAHASSASCWPMRCSTIPVHDFIRFPGEPLSEKATRGFLTRVAAGRLRIPAEFLERVEAHLERMQTPFVA
jgi:DNA (cytosine-5)-methyltransferase 1